MSLVDHEDALVLRLRGAVATELSRRAREGDRPLARDDEMLLARELLNRQLDDLAQTAIAEGRPALDAQVEEQVVRAVFDHLYQLGRLQPLLDDDASRTSWPTAAIRCSSNTPTAPRIPAAHRRH